MKLTLKKYRTIDLVFFCILALVAESISTLALRKFSGAGFYLSLSVMIAIIAIIRWGAVGSVVYIVAGIPMIFITGTDILQGILFYPIANAFIILSTIIFRFYKREKMIKNRLLFLLFQILTFISISLGKGMAFLIINHQFLNIVINYFVSQLFCLIITMLILNVLTKNEGLVINMEKYLLSMRVEEGKNDFSR